MDSVKRVTLILTIVLALTLLLSFCAPDVPEGTVIGKGHDFTSGDYYLILAPGCTDCESVAVRVTEEEYNNYDTGDFYTGE